jgi:outer membrane protein TolC
VILTCAALAGQAHADEIRPLSLAQAIERAVAGNPDLKRARVAVAKTAAQRLAAAGKFDLQLTAQLLSQRDIVPTINCTPSCYDPFAYTTTSGTASAGLSRQLETGGLLGLSLSAQHTSGFFSPDNSPEPITGTAASAAWPTLTDYYQANLTLAFSHPLWRGFGTEIALADLRRARIQQDIAELARQMRACNVVRDVAIAYWELAYATQALAIRRSAVDLAEEQLRITRAMIGVGRLADADAASVERAIAQRLEDQATGEQDLSLRSLDLELLFGLPVDASGPSLAATDAPVAGLAPIEERTEVAHALEANPQLRALRRGIDLSEADLALAANTLKPKLDLDAKVGPVGRRPGLPGSLGQASRMSDFTWSAGLTFELPVQNRAARGLAAAAEQDRQLARIDADDFAARIRDLVLRTTHSIRTAAKRVELGQREVEFAGKNLTAERARFGAGRATNNDVMLRQQELKDAETRLLRATVDQTEAEVALASVTAEILDRYDIVLR